MFYVIKKIVIFVLDEIIVKIFNKNNESNNFRE